VSKYKTHQCLVDSSPIPRNTELHREVGGINKARTSIIPKTPLRRQKRDHPGHLCCANIVFLRESGTQTQLGDLNTQYHAATRHVPDETSGVTEAFAVMIVCPMHYKLLLNDRFVLDINCWPEMRGHRDKVVFVSCLQNGVLP
jgi:hypothetical protein